MLVIKKTVKSHANVYHSNSWNQNYANGNFIKFSKKLFMNNLIKNSSTISLNIFRSSKLDLIKFLINSRNLFSDTKFQIKSTSF